MSRILWLLALILISYNPVAPAQAQADIPFESLPDCGFDLNSGVPNLQMGAVVYNIETGAGCIQNLDTVFPIASVPKLFVSGAYHQSVALNMVRPSDTVRYDESYHMGGFDDCLTEWDFGRDVTLRELNNIMITCSDNAATWMLMDAIGWNTVQAYIDGLGIDGIGPVIPYAEVDRLKLTAIDPLWATVPPAMASRYWRSRDTEGLRDYFNPLPRYDRDDTRYANTFYFNNYNYNTATPRAIAEYLMMLRDDYLNAMNWRWDVANGVLGDMLGTQRQYSAQYFPGTVYVGAKNGFDLGLVAEVNFTINHVNGYNREPDTIAIVFTRQTNLNGGNVQSPRQSGGVLNQFLWALSPEIVNVLWPEFQPPPMVTNWTINMVRFSTPDSVDNCWYPYRDSGFNPAFIADFELCLAQTPQNFNYFIGQEAALGLVLRGLNYQDTRLTFIYTSPDGVQRSYQTRAPHQNDAGVNWFHPVTQSGTWTLDIYVNLELAYSGSFDVN